MTHAAPLSLSRSEEFKIRERFHVFVLLLAPLFVFLGGLSLATGFADAPIALRFLNAFGGAFLCFGAVVVYIVILLRRVLHQAPVLRALSRSEGVLTPTNRISRLAVLLIGFLGAWAVHAVYGISGHVLFHIVFNILMILFGMLYVTLATHFHAHH
jgi:hypothetical protein